MFLPHSREGISLLCFPLILARVAFENPHRYTLHPEAYTLNPHSLSHTHTHKQVVAAQPAKPELVNPGFLPNSLTTAFVRGAGRMSREEENVLIRGNKINGR